MTQGSVVLLPGIYGSGPAHWQSRWQSGDPAHFSRFAPSDWDEPRLDDWVAAVDRSVATATAPPVLVAHSLSCLLVPFWVARGGWAASLPPVAGAVLVAPVDPTAAVFPTAAHEFADVPRGPLPFPTLVVGSRNDDYATLAWSREYAADLAAAFVDAGTLGHINADSGLADWPWGRGLLAGFTATLGT